jgi:tripartite-type tricarboxylate transporter receptor subunit TctC
MKAKSLPLVLLLFNAPAIADTAADFYKGKTMTLVIGMAPPDQHDNDGRTLARHIGKYIPGNPNIIIQNMPGAGALKAAQYLAHIAPRDGLTFALLQRGVYMMPLLGYPDATYDPLKFSFIGSRSPETSITVVWHQARVKTIQQAMQEEVVLASAGGGGDGNVLPFLYNETLGTKFKVIGGYPGGGEMNLAVERREVDGRGGWSMGAMRGTHEDWYQEKKVTILLQHGLRKHSEIPDVPLAQDMAKNEDDRSLIELFGKQQGIGFAFVAPTDVPADRLKALREAFAKTMLDPAYLAEASNMKADLNPLSAAQMEALVRDIYATPRAIVDRAKRILIANGAKLN